MLPSFSQPDSISTAARARGHSGNRRRQIQSAALRVEFDCVWRISNVLYRRTSPEKRDAPQVFSGYFLWNLPLRMAGRDSVDLVFSRIALGYIRSSPLNMLGAGVDQLAFRRTTDDEIRAQIRRTSSSRLDGVPARKQMIEHMLTTRDLE